MKRFLKLSACLLMALIVTCSLACIPQLSDTPVVQTAEAASSITLNKTTTRLAAGQTTTLQVSGTKKTVTWTSSNKSVATVSSSGKVTAKKAGTATITAKVGSKKLNCKVTVVELSASKVRLASGKTKTLKVSGTTATVKWTSSNKSVATVSSSGKVTAKAAGTATITATVGSTKMTCKVTVVKLSASKASLNVGAKKKLKVSGTTSTVTWSSSNKSVASVSSSGTVTAKKPGTATITAKVGTAKMTCKVTVKAPVLYANKTSVKITEEDGRATVNVTYNGSSTISWESTDRTVAVAEWGSWDGRTIPLTIKAKDKGTAYINVSDKNGELVKIKVTIDYMTEQEYKESLVTVSIENSLPESFSDFDYKGYTDSSYTLEDFSYSVKYYSHSDDYTIYLYFTGKKTYDSEGPGHSQGVRVGWKLYDEDGYVVDSGTELTSALAMGEGFRNEEAYVFDIVEPGHYTVKILDTK